MTDEAEPGRPPAHDLAAFDLAKRSPEQLAQSFAQWKARRRPPQAVGSATPAPSAVTSKAGKPAAPSSRAAAPKRGWAKRSITVQYSDSFSSLLAAGSEPAMQRTEPAPIVVARPSAQRKVSPGRRLRAITIVAGAASLVALAGGALLELSSWREAEPQSAPVRPAMEPAATPIARVATSTPVAAWTLQPMVDRALLKFAAPSAALTVSKAASSAKPAPPQPAFKKAAPATAQFVAKPFIPNAAPQPTLAAPALTSIRTAPLETAIHTGDPRPDALFQHGRKQGDAAFSGRLASGSKPAATSKPNRAAQAPAAARNGKSASAGSGDPRGESSGGAQAPAGTEADGAADAAAGNSTDHGDRGSASGDGGADAGGSDGGNNDVGGSDGADSGQSDAGDSEGGTSDVGPADGAPGGESSPGNADTGQAN